MLNHFTKINFLLWGPIEDLINLLMRGVYGLYFGFIKAIAWILDMLTQLFFIFAGMTPVSSTTVSSSDGKAGEIDIVNFFLTQKTFQKAYLYLCLVALGLIIVFTIGKIIKQDYFDRNGPRSKGPIFRSVALSFIAFICVIPIFYFLIDVVAALALLVMQAMGYKGGGIGSLIFNICWDDNGESIRTVAQSIGNVGSVEFDGILWSFDDNLVPSKTFDPDNFGWYSGDTFYAYYWDPDEVASMNSVLAVEDLQLVTFHWHIFIFTGLILIVNLGQMMLAMVTRMYNLIALFIVAPSPISQIVLDDGQKFKGWKDKVIQEALKVVGCVMSFMLFIMIVGVVNELDLMRYAFTEKAASALNLIEDNNLTTELSNSISGMYYNDAEEATLFDKAINALGRCMIIIAGVGAIKDIDQTITPFISGAKTSMDAGYAGQAITRAGGMAAKGALDIGKKAIGAAVGLASAGVGMAAGIGLNAMESLGGAADSARQIFNANREDGEQAPPPGGGDNPPGGGDNDGAQDIPGGGNDPAPDTNTPTDEGGQEEAQDVPGDGPGDGGPEGTDPGPSGEGGQEEAQDVPGGAAPDVDAAKENLDNATRRDNNKNVVLDEMEKILDKDPKDRTEDDNKKLEQLEKAFDQIDASGDTKFEAQKKYDEAVAAQSAQEGDATTSAQDGSAAAEDVPGADIPEPSQQEDNDAAEDVPGGDTPENVEPTEGTEGGSGEEASGDSGSAGGEQSTGAAGNEGTDSSGASAGVGAPSSNNSSGNTRFATLHEHGRLGTGAKIAKGALAATGFTTTFASKLAFGTAGQVLKHGKKAVGTTAKAGLSIAGIAAKTVLGMTGMGGVANTVGGFVGGVVADTADKVKGLGKDLKKQGSDFVKRNTKMVDSQGNRVDKDGNRLDSSGNVMKDKDGNAIKGVGDPTYQSSLGSVLGATGNVVNGAKNAVGFVGRGIADGSIVSGQLRYASGVIDRASRERTFLSDEAERRLNTMNQAQRDANNMIDDMNNAVSPGSEGDYSSAAGAAVDGAEQQLMVASDMNNLTENVGAERNAELDVNDGDVEKINNAYAAQEAYRNTPEEEPEDPSVTDQRERLTAIASDTEGTEKANERKEALKNHFDNVVDPNSKNWKSGSRTPFLGKKYGGTNNWRERSKRVHAIYARSKALDNEYADVIQKVKSGDPVDAGTMEKYSEYLGQARQLDNAYMYAHSGYGKGGEGQEAFESMQYELEHGVGGTDKDVNPEYRIDTYDGTQHLEDIKARAEDMVGLGEKARKNIPPVPEPKPKPEPPEDPENIKASAATKLKAASIRADAARQEYDRVTAEGSGASDEDIAAAEAKVQETIGDVAKYSNQVKTEFGKTEKSMLHASRNNERRNVGNENFERAVRHARTSVSVAKSKGKISQSKADKLNSQIDAMESAGQASYNDGSRAVHEAKIGRSGRFSVGRSGVKGTRKIMNKTLHVRAKSGNLQDATSSTPVPDRIRTSRSPNPMSAQEQDEILVNLSVVEEEELNQGIGGPGLVEMRNACVDYSRNAWAGMQQDADSFMSRVASVNVDTKFKDERLTLAISQTKKENVPASFKGTVKAYKEDAMNRYESAVDNYNRSMESATQLARQYSMDRNPETLRAVEESIQLAVRSSEEIRGLKVELNIKDED